MMDYDDNIPCMLFEKKTTLPAGMTQCDIEDVLVVCQMSGWGLTVFHPLPGGSVAVQFARKVQMVMNENGSIDLNDVKWLEKNTIPVNPIIIPFHQAALPRENAPGTTFATLRVNSMWARNLSLEDHLLLYDVDNGVPITYSRVIETRTLPFHEITPEMIRLLNMGFDGRPFPSLDALRYYLERLYGVEQIKDNDEVTVILLRAQHIPDDLFIPYA